MLPPDAALVLIPLTRSASSLLGLNTATFRAAYGVPAEYTPIGALAIGHPAPDHRSPSLRRGRRPVAEVAHWGEWRR